MKVVVLMILTGLFLTAAPAWAITVDETGCLSPGDRAQKDDTSSDPVSREELFRQSYDEAECLRKAAAAAGAEWLETESLLRRSLEEADQGHWDTASQLVQKANFQAVRALQQAEHEATAWKQRVVD